MLLFFALMGTLLWAMGATVLVSLASFAGIISLIVKKKYLTTVLFVLVGFSAGALMGDAFLHMIPESLESATPQVVAVGTLFGFIVFFFVERFLHWRHCHDETCKVHPFTHMTMVGDSIHNFIDGLIIAVSFLVSVPLGIVSTLAIIAHEVPQEMGNLGVLIYGGFSKNKALLYNFLTQTTAVLGAIIGYFFSTSIELLRPFLLPFAAGGFLYIAASDLVPELHKEKEPKKALLSMVFFIVGIVLMWVLKVFIV